MPFANEPSLIGIDNCLPFALHLVPPYVADRPDQELRSHEDGIRTEYRYPPFTAEDGISYVSVRPAEKNDILNAVLGAFGGTAAGTATSAFVGGVIAGAEFGAAGGAIPMAAGAVVGSIVGVAIDKGLPKN